MTKREARTILVSHNLWRRGAEGEMPYTAKEIGQAIDVAVETLKDSISPPKNYGTKAQTKRG